MIALDPSFAGLPTAITRDRAKTRPPKGVTLPPPFLDRTFEHIARYSTVNEGSVREYQVHNRQHAPGATRRAGSNSSTSAETQQAAHVLPALARIPAA